MSAAHCRTAGVGVLDDHGGGVVSQAVHQPIGRLGVEEVEVAAAPCRRAGWPDPTIPHRWRSGSGRPPGGGSPRSAGPGPGGGPGAVSRAGDRICLVGVVQPRHDGGVVRGGVGEGIARQTASSGRRESALGPQFGQDELVVGRIDDHPDVGVVLGRGPHHGGATDVDHLDARLGRERVEVARRPGRWGRCRASRGRPDARGRPGRPGFRRGCGGAG